MKYRSVSQRLAAIGAALVIVAAACGGDDESTETTAAPASTEAAPTTDGGTTDDTTADTVVDDLFAESKAKVERLLAPPTGVGVSDPLTAPIPEGVKAVFLECPVTDCTTFAIGAEEAAGTVGWDFARIPFDLTPESSQAAFDQAIDEGANVIMSVGADPSWLVEQRKRAIEEDVVFVDCCTVYEPDAREAIGDYSVAEAPPAAVHNNADFTRDEAATMADWAIVERQGDINGLIVYIPDFPLGVLTADGINDRLAEVCPDTCTTSELYITIEDIGTNAPSMVVSELQRDPSINTIFFITGAFSIGVTPAIVEAGLQDQVIMTGNSGSSTNFQEMITSSVKQSWLGIPLEVIGWRYIDSAIRVLQGEEIPTMPSGPEDTSAAAWPAYQLLTADNFEPMEGEYVMPENFREIFAEIWGL